MEVYLKECQKQRANTAVNDLHYNLLPLSISPRKLSIYLTNKNYNKILSQVDIYIFEKIKNTYPKIKELWNLSADFRCIFKSKSIKKLQKWIRKASESSFIKI